jgi:hypothetical protein
MRPIEYWEQHVPDYGHETTAADLAAIRSRPRVRPEDVVLTAEERARQVRRPGSVLRLSEAIRVVVVVFSALLLLYLGLAFLIWLL